MNVLDYVRRLSTLRGAFRRTFLAKDGKPTADAEIVLDELRRFCYGNRTALKAGAGGPSADATLVAAARQEVYWRVMDMLNLDDSDLAVLHKRAQIEDANG